MFIYHFNRLIHNKIVWGCFAFIIALTFGLSFGSSSLSSCQRGSTDPVAGKLNGKPITQAQLNQAQNAIRNANASQRQESLSSAVVLTQALTRVAIERLAHRNSLSATTPEIQAEIKQIQGFQQNGVFSHQHYQMVLASQLSMTPDQFEDLIAQDIAASKLASLVGSASWISPSEAEDQLANATDYLTLQYAILQDQFATSAITPSEQQIQDYYNKHIDSFMIPDQVAVDYVAIPYTNYIPRLVITEDHLRAHYEDNLDTYTHIQSDGTNDIPVQLAFEDVTNSILATLRNEFAREAAQTNAGLTLLDMALNANSLSAVATHLNLPVVSTALFGSEGPAGVESPRKFALAVTEESDFTSPLSSYNIYLGDRHLYLFTPTTNVLAHIPPLDAIRPAVTARATAQAKADAFNEQQQSVYDSLKAALDAGKSFADAATDAGLTTSTNITLVISELRPSPDFPEAYSVAAAAMPLLKGQLAKPTMTPPKGAAFVYLNDRQPGDPDTIKNFRDQIRDSQLRNQANFVASQWRADVTKNLHYVPTRTVIADE